ncbi:FecCD family ABC transporter permease [Neptunomonas phycophila]|uniref:FecCD family ABC transporter permease n=1 Tax=Neptunomonas phycophila TaxID=1572645 RepID=UPI003515B18A
MTNKHSATHNLIPAPYDTNDLSASIYDYKKQARKRLLLLAGLSALVIIAFLMDLYIGSQGLSYETFMQGLFHSEIAPGEINKRAVVIVWDIRMPSAIMALLIDMILAVSGAQMQTVLKNPLADPFTLGLSSAAGFGASLAIVLNQSFASYLPIPDAFFIPLNAFIFSLMTALLVSFAGIVKRLTPATVTLLGIATMFGFNALLTLVEYLASADQLQELLFWIMGSLAKASWLDIKILLAFMLVSLPLIFINAWKLTAIRANEELARARGISAERIRVQVLIVVSLLTAAAVSFAGTIGFVGLVAPHIARMLVGEEQRWFLPATLLIGAAVMSFTSLISKALVPGVLFPVGVITALIGIPFFLSLILSSKRSHWS